MPLSEARVAASATSEADIQEIGRRRGQKMKANGPLSAMSRVSMNAAGRKTVRGHALRAEQHFVKAPLLAERAYPLRQRVVHE